MIKHRFGAFPRGPGWFRELSLLESFPTILVPLRLRSAELWPKTLGAILSSAYDTSSCPIVSVRQLFGNVFGLLVITRHNEGDLTRGFVSFFLPDLLTPTRTLNAVIEP